MRKYRISELTGNEILAQSVYLENGQVLLEKGTSIDKSYKESLLALNIQDVFIQDKYELYEKPNFYLEKKRIIKFQKELEEILAHHVYKENERLKKLQGLAEKITGEVCQIENKKVIDMEERMGNLYQHIIYTTIWCLILGKEYEFSKKQMENLALGALLHDLGLCYTNVNYTDCHLEKMTPIEIFELKKHTILAYTALEQEAWIPEIAKKMILSHHEKMDGSGYPLKQKNQETECRIIQICDTMDGIMCGMEQKRESLSKALEEIGDSHRYDTKMAELLKNKIARYPVGTQLQLEDGTCAVVIEQTENPFQPKIVELKVKEIHPRCLTEQVIHIF